MSEADLNAVMFDEGRALTASMLWGRVITHLRNNGPQNLFVTASEIKEVDSDGEKLALKVKESDFEAIVSYSELLQDVLDRLCGGIKLLIVKIENKEEQLFLADIERLKRLIGKVPLTIK